MDKSLISRYAEGDTWQKYIYKGVITGKHKKKEFFNFWCKREKINPNNFLGYFKIFNDFYKDNWDYSIVGRYFIVTIKFPFITITNYLGESHLIRDFYVEIKFYNTGISDFLSFRTTITNYENKAGYSHSHVPTQGLGTFLRLERRAFCLGQGELRDLQHKVHNEDTLENFLFGLNTYLKWESLEGGPYITISGVKTAFLKISNSTLDTTNICNTIERNPELFDLEFYVEKGEFKIKFGKNTIKEILKIEEFEYFKVYKIENLHNTYVRGLQDTKVSNVPRENRTGEYYFYFRGEKIFPKVINVSPEKGFLLNTEATLSSGTVENIINNLQKRFYEKYSGYSRIIYKNKCSNESRSFTADTIFM